MEQLLETLKTEPETKVTYTNGQVEMIVNARHIKPGDAMVTDWLATLIAFIMVMAAITIAVASREITPPPVILALGGLLGRSYIENKLRKISVVSANIRFTEAGIFLQPAPIWNPVPEWKSFDRRQPHRFVLLPHDLAEAEGDTIQHQQRNRPGAQVKQFYSASYYVVLEYLGERYDVAEVWGPRDANSIRARLDLCDQYMNGVANERQRLPMKAEDQWANRPGSVPM